jgi:hypothetical protein
MGIKGFPGMTFAEPRSLAELDRNLRETSRGLVLWDAINNLKDDGDTPEGIEDRMALLKKDVRANGRVHLVIAQATSDGRPYAFNEINAHASSIFLLSIRRGSANNRELSCLAGSAVGRRVALNMTSAGLIADVAPDVPMDG